MEPTIQDFSTWKEIYNITSWNYNSLYPYFRKMFDDIKYNVGGVIQSQVSFFRDSTFKITHCPEKSEGSVQP